MWKFVENGITVLNADDGMKLTNGETFGATVRLGVYDSPDNWYEITEAEAEQLMAVEDEEATEADYQNALAEMGVKV